jgi:adenosylcobinamide-GDP ribazoletransferase
LGFLAALQFLTVLPIKRNFDSRQVGGSSIYFPVVGLCIGLLLAAVNFLLHFILPQTVVNIFLVAILALCSGGLHLDGVADTFDGIAGHRSTERRLEIMRDSRIGGFGAIGLGMVLIMEYVMLNSVPVNVLWLVLILAPVVSRWCMVYAIASFPYARPEGLGKAFKEAVTGKEFGIATAIPVVLCIGLLGASGLIVLAGAWLVTLFLSLYLSHLLKGLTGDTYGAINEIATLSVFLMAILITFNHWLAFSWWV